MMRLNDLYVFISDGQVIVFGANDNHTHIPGLVHLQKREKNY